MKLLYVFTSAGIASGSVQEKVLNQIRSLKRYGVECHGLFLTTDDTNESFEDYQFIKVPKIPKGWFRSFRQRMAIHRTLKNWFAVNRPECDFIYCRYPGSSRHIAAWARKYGKKIFFEHVTSETNEIKLYTKENPLKLNLSSLLGNLEFYFLPLTSERLYGRYIRNKASFGISNSENIAEYENRIAGKNYALLIAGDAVNTSNFERRHIHVKPGELHLIFLKGAATAAEFNGLDRIFKGMAAYKGDRKIHLHLYGRNLNWEKAYVQQLDLSSMVSFSDFVDSRLLNSKLEQIDLGLGAFGVHRKGLLSTTTIKAREYFARGLPFIFGHNDPDLSGNPELKACCMEFPADDSAIDFNQVIQWYDSIRDLEKTADFMHEYAKNSLDYDVKMKRLINFLITYKKSEK